MKKLFYLFIISLLLCSCSKAKTANMPAENAKNIYKAFLTVKQDNSLTTNFQNCRFEYKVTNNAGAYSCEVPVTENQRYFFVISDAKEFKNEVNPIKQNAQDLVYIAYLNYDEDARKMTGEKLLFSPKENLIIDNQEIKKHF